MMFADTIPSWQSTVAVLAMCGAGTSILFGAVMLYYMKVQTDSFREQTRLQREQADNPTIIGNQPLSVEVVKAMHEQFADRDEFDQHVKTNTERHGQIFSRIDHMLSEVRAEDDKIRADLSEKFQAIQRSLGRIEGQLSKDNS